MSSLFKPWDIWLASVPFEECATEKVRPVLVLSESRLYIISAKITTHPPRPQYAREYQIRKYKEAGLPQPPTVRAGRTINLPQNKFIKKLGTLQREDIAAIQSLLR